MDSMSISTSESPVGARTIRSWMILMTWLRRSGGRLLMSSESWAFSWKVRGCFILAALLAAADGFAAAAFFSIDVWSVTSVCAAVFLSDSIVSCIDSICFCSLTNSVIGIIVSSSPPSKAWAPRGPLEGCCFFLAAFLLPDGARSPGKVSSSSNASPPRESSSPPRFFFLPFSAAAFDDGAAAPSCFQTFFNASSNLSCRSRAASWTGASGNTLNVTALRNTRRISAANACTSVIKPSSSRRFTVPRAVGDRMMER
mmetsp:Transcript_26746/g.82118  ORF Transcript_26746/g.82118 Transcript_26746/m.82118 type:complete len:256 (-) Transcript_26746:751-1518(-)